MNYRKLWFSNGEEQTAGIVVSDEWITKHAMSLVPDASRLFPTFEAPKMRRLYLSEAFTDWNEAFAFEVPQ